MLRESNIQPLTWADKTMSVLRARQLEACEERLSALPGFGLFSGCDESNVEALYAASHDAQEHPVPTRLHTAQSLRAQVLSRLPAEAALLTFEEHMLLERLLVLDGTCELMDWEETGAAESLVRRLWCTISREEERIFVHLPRELLVPLTLIVSSRAHEELREKLTRYDATIRALLYIGGLLHVQEPLHRLMEDVLKGTYAQSLPLAQRFLRCEYDYTYDRRGDMLLLHPGLAEPERMLGQGERWAGISDMDEETLQGAMAGIFPEEQPLFEQMYGLIAGAVRPEITEEEAVEDLRMLAKQGVSLQEMNEVLASLLTVLPTPAMLDGVKQLYQRTPRWGTMHAAMVQ
ncbi:MAG: hypothetical protein ACI4OY_02930 [Aristaeellaceae bacterium]